MSVQQQLVYDNSALNGYFDETIFTDGRSFQQFAVRVYVNNRIDYYLAKRLQMNVRYVCNSSFDRFLQANNYRLEMEQSVVAGGAALGNSVNSASNIVVVPEQCDRVRRDPQYNFDVVKQSFSQYGRRASTAAAAVAQRAGATTASGAQRESGAGGLAAENIAYLMLNPSKPCRGMCVYTLDIFNKNLLQVEPFASIRVMRHDAFPNIEAAAAAVDANSAQVLDGWNAVLAVTNQLGPQQLPIDGSGVQSRHTIPLKLFDLSDRRVDITGVIWTVGEFNAFESALLLKYYAMSLYQTTLMARKQSAEQPDSTGNVAGAVDAVAAHLSITTHLYMFVRKYFEDDHRKWFDLSASRIIQNSRKELLMDSYVINMPDLTIGSEDIVLNSDQS